MWLYFLPSVVHWSVLFFFFLKHVKGNNCNICSHKPVAHALITNTLQTQPPPSSNVVAPVSSTNFCSFAGCTLLADPKGKYGDYCKDHKKQGKTSQKNQSSNSNQNQPNYNNQNYNPNYNSPSTYQPQQKSGGWALP